MILYRTLINYIIILIFYFTIMIARGGRKKRFIFEIFLFHLFIISLGFFIEKVIIDKATKENLFYLSIFPIAIFIFSIAFLVYTFKRKNFGFNFIPILFSYNPLLIVVLFAVIYNFANNIEEPPAPAPSSSSISPFTDYIEPFENINIAKEDINKINNYLEKYNTNIEKIRMIYLNINHKNNKDNINNITINDFNDYRKNISIPGSLNFIHKLYIDLNYNQKFSNYKDFLKKIGLFCELPLCWKRSYVTPMDITKYIANKNSEYSENEVSENGENENGENGENENGENENSENNKQNKWMPVKKGYYNKSKKGETSNPILLNDIIGKNFTIKDAFIKCGNYENCGGFSINKDINSKDYDMVFYLNKEYVKDDKNFTENENWESYVKI